MSHFTIRIELHAANDNDYETLHKAALKRGILRRIMSDEGKWYELPPGVYFLSGASTLQEVRAKAEAAAAETGRRHAVLVTSGDSCWSGLSFAS